MTGLRIPRAHSNDWYDHLVTLQEGYYYPWESTLDPRNGAQAFEDMVMSSLSEDTVVLEVGCGWGGFAEVAAGDYGADVVGLTLSQEQARYANERLSPFGERVSMLFPLIPSRRASAGPGAAGPARRTRRRTGSPVHREAPDFL